MGKRTTSSAVQCSPPTGLTNYQIDGPAAIGSRIVKDIATLIAYNIDDLLEMCLGHNAVGITTDPERRI